MGRNEGHNDNTNLQYISSLKSPSIEQSISFTELNKFIRELKYVESWISYSSSFCN